jgi:hypothetical protein
MHTYDVTLKKNVNINNDETLKNIHSLCNTQRQRTFILPFTFVSQLIIGIPELQ